MYRDIVVSTHPLEKQPLSSYPLKIAAMHYTANTRDKGIYTDMLGALRLLDPELNNTVDGLCSFMIEDDPIIKEGEVAQSWSRLIADKLQSKARNLKAYNRFLTAKDNILRLCFLTLIAGLCVGISVQTAMTANFLRSQTNTVNIHQSNTTTLNTWSEVVFTFKAVAALTAILPIGCLVQIIYTCVRERRYGISWDVEYSEVLYSFISFLVIIGFVSLLLIFLTVGTLETLPIVPVVVLSCALLLSILGMVVHLIVYRYTYKHHIRLTIIAFVYTVLMVLTTVSLIILYTQPSDVLNIANYFKTS